MKVQMNLEYLNHTNKAGNTPLQEAELHNNTDVARIIRGSVEEKSHREKTFTEEKRCAEDYPLHATLARTEEVPGVDEIKKMVKGRDSAVFKKVDGRGNLPLHYAAAACGKEVIEYLVNLVTEKEINKKNKEGNTPLHLAAKTGNDSATATACTCRHAALIRANHYSIRPTGSGRTPESALLQARFFSPVEVGSYPLYGG